MELRHLRYFVAVAEELHFGRAARALHISQPPLSQQIAALEEEMGVRLFERVGRHIELTEAGASFLTHSRQVLAHVKQAVNAAQRIENGEVGQLSIGFVSSMAYTCLPWVLRAFGNQYKEVSLLLHELTIPEQVRAIDEGRIHIGLLRPPIANSAVTTKIALEEPYVVVLPDDHPQSRRAKVALKTLANTPFIMFPRRIGGTFYDQVVGLCREAGFDPIVEHEVTQMHAVVGMVSARLGVSIVPASIERLRIDGVVFRPLAGPVTVRSQTAVAWRSGDASPLVQAFVDVACSVLGRNRRTGGGRI